MATPFEIKKSYSFSTLSPEILGENYTNLLVTGIFTVEDALRYYSDIYNRHTTLKNIIPGLPDITDCSFIVFKDSTGNKSVLALEYIDIVSIKVVTTTNLRITLTNTSNESASILSLRLKELGYTNFNIEEF